MTLTRHSLTEEAGRKRRIGRKRRTEERQVILDDLAFGKIDVRTYPVFLEHEIWWAICDWIFDYPDAWGER